MSTRTAHAPLLWFLLPSVAVALAACNQAEESALEQPEQAPATAAPASDSPQEGDRDEVAEASDDEGTPSPEQLPVAEDFEPEVTAAIDESNYQRELDAIEKELATDE